MRKYKRRDKTPQSQNITHKVKKSKNAAIFDDKEREYIKFNKISVSIFKGSTAPKPRGRRSTSRRETPRRRN